MTILPLETPSLRLIMSFWLRSRAIFDEFIRHGSHVSQVKSQSVIEEKNGLIEDAV